MVVLEAYRSQWPPDCSGGRAYPRAGRLEGASSCKEGSQANGVPNIGYGLLLMSCKSCAERRKKFQALREAKKLKRQGIQAVAIGAVLGAFEAGGKMLGINGEEDNEGQQSRSTTGAEASASPESPFQDQSGRGESD